MLTQIFFRTTKIFTLLKPVFKQKMKKGEESDVYELHQAQMNVRSDCFPIIFSLLKKLRVTFEKRHSPLYAGSL